MILFKRAGDLSGWLQGQRSQGKSIGFVPTMGALHAGHISLIDISKKTTGVTVCSIFVNPTQFNDPKDFQKYPITIEKDIYLLEKAGTDALFLPEMEELYPGGTADLERYALGRLETLLEGKYRPGHFQGVCQVMRRLLDIVEPDDLFMGQKDYQQCMVVSKLIELRQYATRLHPCPIVREADGLAMSSRNMRLTESERGKAPAIYRALSLIKQEWEEGVAAAGAKDGADDFSGRDEGVQLRIKGDRHMGGDLSETALQAMLLRARAILEEAGFRIDYVEVADAKTLEPLGGADAKSLELFSGEGAKSLEPLLPGDAGADAKPLASSLTGDGGKPGSTRGAGAPTGGEATGRRLGDVTTGRRSGEEATGGGSGEEATEGGSGVVALVAAFLGEIRLIDNLLL